MKDRVHYQERRRQKQENVFRKKERKGKEREHKQIKYYNESTKDRMNERIGDKALRKDCAFSHHSQLFSISLRDTEPV